MTTTLVVLTLFFAGLAVVQHREAAKLRELNAALQEPLQQTANSVSPEKQAGSGSREDAVRMQFERQELRPLREAIEQLRGETQRLNQAAVENQQLRRRVEELQRAASENKPRELPSNSISSNQPPLRKSLGREYLGTWMNESAQPLQIFGLRRVVIRGDAFPTSIKVWLPCSPQDCEWPEVELVPLVDFAAPNPKPSIGWAEWAFPDRSTNTAIVTLEGERLRVELICRDVRKSGLGRTRTADVFVRISE